MRKCVIFVLVVLGASSVLIVLSITNNVIASEPILKLPAEIGDDDKHYTVNKMQLSDQQRGWFRNPDGSCVQCSIGMGGVHTNTPEATTLLWDTQYGPRVRGGSGPSRVADYMNKRKIKGWNITGQQTYDWMRWSCRTGRFAAIGAGGSHFQTLYGYDTKTKTWYVCNNNSPQRIDEYNEQGFHNLHEASGEWIVVLEKSNSENPEYTNWWEKN